MTKKGFENDKELLNQRLLRHERAPYTGLIPRNDSSYSNMALGPGVAGHFLDDLLGRALGRLLLGLHALVVVQDLLAHA